MIMIGYIYKIWDNDDLTLVYYGSTKQQVSIRMGKHRAQLNPCKSKIIIDRNNYQYATLEKIEYEDKFELHNRERWWIENNECVNKSIPNRTQKEYHIANKEKIKEERKQYYAENKEKLVEKQKIYNDKNKEKILEQKKQYYIENSEKILEKQKQKIICECGCVVVKYTLTRHKKSNKHLKWLQNQS